MGVTFLVGDKVVRRFAYSGRGRESFMCRITYRTKMGSHYLNIMPIGAETRIK